MNSSKVCLVNNNNEVASNILTGSGMGDDLFVDKLSVALSNKAVAPEFKTPLVDIDVVAGSSTKFVVQIVNSSGKLKVSWYHNEFPVQNSDRHTILQEGDFHCIQIKDVTPKDEGQWTCKAENVAGAMSCYCILHVTCPPVFRPPQFLSGLRGFLWDNGTISLECEVKGRPTPNLRWYKDGSQILEGASLTIRAKTKEPNTLIGIFACEAQNCVGTTALYTKVYAKEFCNFLNRFSKDKQI